MSVRNWSTAEASNSNSDIAAGINLAEEQEPATIKGSPRAIMAEIKKWANDIGGAIVSTGTEPAYVLTTGSTITALEDGLRLTFRAHASSTGAATVTVDGLASKDILRADATATQSGDIVSGGVYDLVYSTTAAAFIGLNIGLASGGTGGAVLETDFDAQTILAATTDDTPVALTVDEQRLVGRITGGNIAALTGTQVNGIILPGNFTPSHTGGVARTLRSKVEEVVSVEDFGAAGDGGTDDSAAVQAAIDYIVDNELSLFMPAGNYLLNTAVSKTLSADKKFKLIGDGVGVTNFTVPATNTTGGILIAAGTNRGSQMTARDFTVLADGVSLGTGFQFSMTTGGNQHQRSAIVENVEVKGVNIAEDCFDIFMNLAGNWRPSFSRVTCRGPYGPGVSSDFTDASPLYVATAGLVIDDSYDWVVDNCHLWGAATTLRDNGTVAEGGRLTNTVLAECLTSFKRVRTDPEPVLWIEGVHTNFRNVSFDISGAKQVNIRGCHPYNQDSGDEFSGVATDILLVNTERFIISDNIFHYPGAADRINIDLQTATLGKDSLIQGNIFGATADIAVKIGSAATGVVVRDNLYTGAITTRTSDLSGVARVLYNPFIVSSGTALSHTGDTALTTLKTVKIPGGAMGPNGFIHIRPLHTQTSSANTKALVLKIGGTGGTAIDNRSITTNGVSEKSIVIRNRNSQSSQIAFQANNAIGLGNATASVTATIDTSADWEMVFQCQLADAGETITLEAYSIEVVYAE